VAVSGAVLALRALGIGDLLTALPALRALRRRHPRSCLVLAAPAWLAPLAFHAGAVDAVADTQPLGPIEVRRPSLAVNLHGRGPESLRRLLETGPGDVIAFAHPAVPESAGWPRWRQDEHEVLRWCRLLDESGIPADPCRLEISAAGLPAVPAAVRGATLLHPGAKSPARRWPVARWGAVARGELARGRRVAVSAGPGEADLARAVADLAGGRHRAFAVVAGGVLGLAALVAAAGRVACGDTGAGHLATALGRPSVLLFGPTSPGLWGPPHGPRHRVLWAGRTGDPHADRPHPGLLAIEPPAVLRALAEC
jgi:ADP-heptose:LPS heptosyltransferase